MIEINLKFMVVTGDGQAQAVHHSWRPEDLPDPAFLASIEVLVDNGIPVVRVPFHVHEPSRVLHTVCSRDDDEIRAVEW